MSSSVDIWYFDPALLQQKLNKCPSGGQHMNEYSEVFLKSVKFTRAGAVVQNCTSLEVNWFKGVPV